MNILRKKNKSRTDAGASMKSSILKRAASIKNSASIKGLKLKTLAARTQSISKSKPTLDLDVNEKTNEETDDVVVEDETAVETLETMVTQEPVVVQADAVPMLPASEAVAPAADEEKSTSLQDTAPESSPEAVAEAPEMAPTEETDKATEEHPPVPQSSSSAEAVEDINFEPNIEALVDGDNNTVLGFYQPEMPEEMPEPEESFIHCSLLNGLWGQAQAATEDSKSWLETNFDKMKTGVNTINEAGPVNDSVAPAEDDARNDCAEASNPALNEEVRA